MNISTKVDSISVYRCKLLMYADYKNGEKTSIVGFTELLSWKSKIFKYRICISFDFELRFYVPFDDSTQNRSFRRRSSQPIVLKKLNPTQQKQTFIRNTRTP